MRASGVRSSCATFASSSFSDASKLSTRSAISSSREPSSPISSPRPSLLRADEVARAERARRARQLLDRPQDPARRDQRADHEHEQAEAERERRADHAPGPAP